MSRFSKTQIDKLGERLREGESTDDDLRMLDEYRLGFGLVYEVASILLRENVRGEISGRAAKTSLSIIQKLRRSKTRHVRLSQVQDVCGLRVVVSGLDAQDDVVSRLRSVFPEAAVEDRRGNPSHGYRAVHMIAIVSGLQVEIQIRTVYQHLWAQFCENLAGKLGIEVKYGANEAAQKLLTIFSDAIRTLEESDSGLVRENPLSGLLRREELVRAFRILIHVVGSGSVPGTREGKRVLPH